MFIPALKIACKELMLTDPRKAAELLYVRAVLAMQGGRKQEAEECGALAVRVLHDINPQTIEAVTAHFYPSVNGVPIPDYVYEEEIIRRLRGIGLKLEAVPMAS